MKSMKLITAGFLLFAVLGYGSDAKVSEPQTHTVTIENMKFTPGTISIRPGDTVLFKNADLVPHTVTERTAKLFDSGMINRDETWKFVAGKEGAFRYRCIYHPDMVGTIVVETEARSSSNH